MIQHAYLQFSSTLKFALVVLVAVLAFEGLVLAQGGSLSQPGAGSRRNFTLIGDLKVDDSQVTEQHSTTFDVILYTRGNEVFARQRVGNGGRYRFNNVFNGDFYLAVELDSVEIARLPILISNNSPEYITQDLEFKWKAGPKGGATGVVDAGSAYDRPSKTQALYTRAKQEINNKNFVQAVATLRSVVETDPKDFPAWSDLGMVYFVQKDLEAAESSYTSAISAKPDHVNALINLGRVRMARKNNEGAIEPLEAALKVDPKSAPANYFLGEAYLAVKKGSKAVGYLNTALEIDPVGMADAHLRLASLYNLAGYKDRAAAEYEQFLVKKPDYPERKKLEEYIQTNKAPKP
jgi:tetratricopeptide (TPR) repeat protein